MWIAVIVVAILLIWFVATFNTFSRKQIKIKEAESGIDVALTKRYDVLTKQKEIAKGFAAHETETFEKVIELRRGMSMAERSVALKDMDELQNSINVVAEAYPELRSSENFKMLQAAVSDTEEHLQAARRAYNANVSDFNQMLAVFPSNLVGGMRHLSAYPFFEADDTRRADVDMRF